MWGEHCKIWDEYLDGLESEFPTKSTKRAIRRKNNYKKAVRKRKYTKLSERPLHYYSKNKNFCSCSMCTPKTNNRGKRYFGRMKIRYKRMNWKHSDSMKVDSMNEKLKEWRVYP